MPRQAAGQLRQLQWRRTEVDADVADVHMRERHELAHVGWVRQDLLCTPLRYEHTHMMRR